MSIYKDKLLQQLARVMFVLFFLLLIVIYSITFHNDQVGKHYLVIAAVIGAYVAVNIGANDVANNTGPAVGSGVLSIFGAIMIAAFFETLGALLAGGEVVKTLKEGIIHSSQLTDPTTFIWIMMAALLSTGIWLHTATALGVPVSTTHAIIGGVIGAAVTANGWQIINWQIMKQIAASWIISPVMGGMIAATLLYYITTSILYQSNRLTAARKVIPRLISFMSWAFITYLLIKGTKQLYEFQFWQAASIGLIIATFVYILTKPIISKAIVSMPDNSRDNINELFTLPLIFSVSILSFAHGANDVANAVGPIAAIYDAVIHSGVNPEVKTPIWVMLLGASGIAVGLTLYGPKLIKTVGSNITNINKTRAYCIAMAASITVIIASQIGLPVSSTHVAVGAIFGVGFLREILTEKYNRIIEDVRSVYEEDQNEKALAFLTKFENANTEDKSNLLQELKISSKTILTKKEQKKLKKIHKDQLVKRSIFIKILTAWFITVPCSALLSAFLFIIFKFSFN